MAALSVPTRRIGIFDTFMAARPETLVLKEKVLSLTGDSFSIKLVEGTPIFKVEGKLRSISGRKKMFDMQGKHLCSIVKEHFHIHATYAVENAAGEKIMEVKSSFKRKFFSRSRKGRRHGIKEKRDEALLMSSTANTLIVFGSKATATITHPETKKQEVLTMNGDFFDTQANIIDEAAGGTSLFLFLHPTIMLNFS
jgi:hypothetical protein